MFLHPLRLEYIRSIARLDMSFQQADGKTRPCTFLLGENALANHAVLSGSDALPEI
jgi:hypothetical protein